MLGNKWQSLFELLNKYQEAYNFAFFIIDNQGLYSHRIKAIIPFKANPKYYNKMLKAAPKSRLSWSFFCL